MSKRINIAGFSSAQNKGTNKKGVINFSGLLVDMLNESGYTAGYDLPDADLNIVFVLDLSSPNVRYYEKALKLLEDKNSILAFDDWSIRNFYKTNQNYLDGTKIFKTHFFVEQDVLNKYRHIIQRIQDGEYKAIYPAYEVGDHSLLEIRGESYSIDPSVFIEKQYVESTSELIPVHASLATKWKDLEKKKYTILNVRDENEDKVFEYYCKHRIVLSPPHYHDGSGWFRNRYALANLAKAVIIEDENSIFGQSYNLQRKDITNLRVDVFFRLQDAAYQSIIMSKQQIKERLEEIL